MTYKYYNKEEKNPYSHNDIRSKFWDGERSFAETHQKSSQWKQEGKEWLKTANDDVKKLAD